MSEITFTFCARCGEQMNPKNDASTHQQPISECAEADSKRIRSLAERAASDCEKMGYVNECIIEDAIREALALLVAENKLLKAKLKNYER